MLILVFIQYITFSARSHWGQFINSVQIRTYCIVNAHRLHAVSTHSWLQFVQNAAVRSLTSKGRSIHISLMLTSLHWLLVDFTIHFKISYVCDLLALCDLVLLRGFVLLVSEEELLPTVFSDFVWYHSLLDLHLSDKEPSHCVNNFCPISVTVSTEGLGHKKICSWVNTGRTKCHPRQLLFPTNSQYCFVLTIIMIFLHSVALFNQP